MINATLITALATCGYFIATIIILIIMARNLREYKNQVKLSNRQLLLTFRPRLDLRIISWRFIQPKSDDEKIKCKIDVDVHNDGKSSMIIHNPHLTITFNMSAEENESWGSSPNLLKHDLMTFEVNQNGKIVFPLEISRSIFDILNKAKFKPYCTIEINMEISWELEPKPKLFTRTFYLTLEGINEQSKEVTFTYRALESIPESKGEIDIKEYLDQTRTARKKYKNGKST